MSPERNQGGSTNRYNSISSTATKKLEGTKRRHPGKRKGRSSHLLNRVEEEKQTNRLLGENNTTGRDNEKSVKKKSFFSEKEGQPRRCRIGRDNDSAAKKKGVA